MKWWKRPATAWDFVIGCMLFFVINVAVAWGMAEYRWQNSPEKERIDAQNREIDRMLASYR